MKIAILPGDGIGPEVTAVAQSVVEKISEIYGHDLSLSIGQIGHSAIEQTGNPLPDETIEICQKADAILLGAVGHPMYDDNPSAKVRPEQGLLKIRKTLGLYANIRPIKLFDEPFAGMYVLHVNIEFAIKKFHQEFRLTFAHKTLIDKHAGELISNRFLQ